MVQVSRMKHLWSTRTKLAVIVTSCLGLLAAVFFAASVGFLDEQNIRKKLAHQLATWTGANVSIDGPVRVHYFPRLLVEVDDVQVRGVSRLPMLTRIDAKRAQGRLSLWSLLFGEPTLDRVTLLEPTFEAETKATESTAVKQSPSAFVAALKQAPVPELYLEQGRIKVIGPTAPEIFENVNVKTEFDPNGGVAARGAFDWRGETVTFGYFGDVPKVPSTKTEPITIPLLLRIAGGLVSAEIEGNAVLRDGLEISGDMSLSIEKLTPFARWTGVLIPEGLKLGSFAAEGIFQLRDHRIGFDDGTFSVNGNRALGALALEVSKPRPKLEGTLALQRIDLTSYLPQETKQIDQPKPSGSAKKATPEVTFDFPILHHINFDVRISTNGLKAGSIELGQSALALVLNAGKLAADIAVFEICGGTANGRLEMDATVPESALKFMSTLKGISIQALRRTI